MLALARIRKAIAAGVAAGAAAFTAGMTDGQLTAGDWVTIVGSVIVVAAVTWAVPNRTT